jgi:hypothetical protein
MASALDGMKDVLKDVDEAETLELRSRRIRKNN